MSMTLSICSTPSSRSNGAACSSAPFRRRETAYISELFRVRGLAYQTLGIYAEAQDNFAMACDVARSQGAATLQRRAEDDMRALVAQTGAPDNDKNVRKGLRA